MNNPALTSLSRILFFLASLQMLVHRVNFATVALLPLLILVKFLFPTACTWLPSSYTLVSFLFLACSVGLLLAAFLSALVIVTTDEYMLIWKGGKSLVTMGKVAVLVASISVHGCVALVAGYCYATPGQWTILSPACTVITILGIILYFHPSRTTFIRTRDRIRFWEDVTTRLSEGDPYEGTSPTHY